MRSTVNPVESELRHIKKRRSTRNRCPKNHDGPHDFYRMPLDDPWRRWGHEKWMHWGNQDMRMLHFKCKFCGKIHVESEYRPCDLGYNECTTNRK